MRIHTIPFYLLPVLVLGCAHFQRPGSEGGDMLLSFPNRLGRGEKVVGLQLHVRNARIVAVNKVPGDWIIRMLVEAPQSQMSGEPNHGASRSEEHTSEL